MARSTPRQEISQLEKYIQEKMGLGLVEIANGIIGYNFDRELQDYLIYRHECGNSHILITLLALERMVNPVGSSHTLDRIRDELEAEAKRDRDRDKARKARKR